MSVRFFKRIKLFPGVTINFSKTGISISIGPKGAKITKAILGKRKGDTRTTVGIPGTGMYYTETRGKQSHKKEN